MDGKSSEMTKEEIGFVEGIVRNLQKYLITLFRQWQWILGCFLLFLIIALAYSFYSSYLRPKTYTAAALVASTQSETSADFGSGIQSASEVQLAQATGSLFYDRGMRLRSLVLQVQNGAVAEQVMQELGPVLEKPDGEPLNASDLLDMVSGDLLPQTDTIQISVKYSDPDIATQIANAWGKAYVQQINQTYSISGTNINVTEEEIAQTKSEYDRAETDLENFIGKDMTAEYQRKVDELSRVVELLRGARVTVGEQLVNDRLTQLTQAWSDSRQVGLLLENAISMRDAINAGGEASAISNALALTMLKTQIYAAYQGTNTLQVQNLPEAMGANISSVTAAGMVADLDSLISTLETRQNDLNSKLAILSDEVQNEDYLMNYSNNNSPIETTILADEQKIRELNSLVAEQTSTLTELTDARDLAAKSYAALATRAAELGANGENTQVVFASSATSALPNNGFSALRFVLLLLLGLLLGIFGAYAYEFWENYNGRQPEMITKVLFAGVGKKSRGKTKKAK
jgi:hypothetical protein